uniref:Phosphotransferase n=1 Tax=Guillardia theta (strain CCMP2712) TaxID=905079 RepID=A0A0C3SLR8_GUITC
MEQLDADSLNKGQQRLEKLIGGMYLGDLCARMLESAIAAKELSLPLSSEQLRQAFTSSLASKIEAASSPADLQQLLQEELKVQVSPPAAQLILEICSEVSSRAATVSGCLLAAIVKHMKLVGQEIVVGIDGSIFKLYTRFKERISLTLEELLGEDGNKVVLEVTLPLTGRWSDPPQLSEDGSGVGAAVIAATAAER